MMLKNAITCRRDANHSFFLSTWSKCSAETLVRRRTHLGTVKPASPPFAANEVTIARRTLARDNRAPGVVAVTYMKS